MKRLFISIFISLGIGILSAVLTSSSMDIYKYLNKPSLAPPSIIFPIVWTLLYILMGISAYLIYKSNDKNKKEALIIYGIQLILNFTWTIIFFLLKFRLLAFINIILLLIFIIIMIIKFYKINNKASLLQIPYLFWVLFATYLNYGFYILNK